MFRDSSMAFKELSFITFKWIKDTHHSVQKQEVRLEQIEQDTQDQGREIYANGTDLYCIQSNYELHEARLEQLENRPQPQEVLDLSGEEVGGDRRRD